MSLNSLKKMIIFSSQNIKDVIENYTCDEAKLEKRSISSIIENHILNDILPTNRSARAFVESMYGEYQWSVEKCLEAIFSYLSAGIDGKAKHDNCMPIVEYARHIAVSKNYRIEPKKKEIHHFRSSFESVIEKLEYDNKNVKWAKDFYKECEDEYYANQATHIFNIILENWESLGNFTYSYRMLADIMAMQDAEAKKYHTPSCDEEDRLELAKILKEVSKDW